MQQSFVAHTLCNHVIQTEVWHLFLSHGQQQKLSAKYKMENTTTCTNISNSKCNLLLTSLYASADHHDHLPTAHESDYNITT